MPAQKTRNLFWALNLAILFGIFSPSAWANAPVAPLVDDCERAFLPSDESHLPYARARQPIPPALESSPSQSTRTAPSWKTEGVYTEADPAAYARYFNSDTTFKMPEILGAVAERDADINLIRANSHEIQHLLRKGRHAARELHYVTSAAGAWTRGRGRLKGLQPFNIRDLVTPSELAHLDFIDRLLNKAGDPEAMLKIAGLQHAPQGLTAEQWATQTIERYLAEEEHLLVAAMRHERAINPLDLKFATVAAASKKSDAYITFDVWLAQGTHPELAQYIQWLSKNYLARRFDTDPQADWHIKMALKSYFEESARRGETHIFGYQEGFHAMDLKTGAPLVETDLLGEGTGMLTQYYQASGRLAELQAMGKRFLIFDNIESLTDITLIAGAHVQAGKAVSTLIVPVSPGYVGGFPYLTRIHGQPGISMIETSILPPEQQAQLPQGGAYFFSGTIALDFTAAGEKHVIGEIKKTRTGRKFMRLKFMIQDITQHVPSAAIIGPTPNAVPDNGVGPVYENFKILGEFYGNGPRMVEHVRKAQLRRDASP